MKFSFRPFILLFAVSLFVFLAFPAAAAPGLDRGPLSKVTFIHYKKGHAKPPQAGGKGGAKCYGFLANGAKWKTAEDYLINPLNQDGMSVDFVAAAVNEGVAAWEYYGGEIFGSGSLSFSASYNEGDFDNVNSVSFGPYGDNGVIAVTTVWGYFYGPPQTRELLEWDLLFNESFTWGDGESNSTVMDLQNIATHELGHSAGLADLYETSCGEETMYGYGTEGETKKRDLNSGDITGIQKLY